MSYKENVKSLLVFIDIVIFFLVFGLSYWVRFHSNLFFTYPDENVFREYFVSISLMTPLYLFFLTIFEIYELKLVFSKKELVINRLKSVSLTLLVFFALSFFIRSISYSRLMFLFVWFFLALFSILSHYLFITINPFPKVLFIINKKNLSLLDDSVFCNMKKYFYLFEGNISNQKIEDLVWRKNVQNVFMFMDDLKSNDLMDINRRLLARGTRFSMVPNLFIELPLKLDLNNYFGILHFDIHLSINLWQNRTLKRIFDLFIIIVSLPFVTPLFFVISILLYIMQRNVFYVQDRVGKDNHVFKMIKFQTMVKGAELETGPIWAKEGDHRVTTMGKYLRKTSLDELPQIINILKGEMSFIGPRPERPFFVKDFGEMWPEYHQRHQVKPGLSGWAQVNGLRGRCSVKERLYFDLYYIYHFSWFLEFKIIIRTLLEFLFHKKAY